MALIFSSNHDLRCAQLSIHILFQSGSPLCSVVRCFYTTFLWMIKAAHWSWSLVSDQSCPLELESCKPLELESCKPLELESCKRGNLMQEICRPFELESCKRGNKCMKAHWSWSLVRAEIKYMNPISNSIHPSTCLLSVLSVFLLYLSLS